MYDKMFEKLTFRKIFKASIKQSIKTVLKKPTMYYPIKLKDDLIKIVNNDAIMSISSYCAMICQKGVFPDHPEYKDMFTIVVHEDFDKLPGYVKSFIIEHEYGHTKQDMKHYNCMSPFIRSAKVSVRGEVDENELNADFYAVRVIGKKDSIRALEFLKQHIPTDVSKKELEIRIKNLSEIQT